MEDDFSRAINALPALIWTALPEGNVDFVNQCWCDYTGIGTDEARGIGWQAAIHPKDISELLERWNSIIASGGPGEMKARLRRFDGEHRWFAFAVNPMRDEAGQILRWYGVNSDIEDRRRAEDNLHAHQGGSFVSIGDGIPALISFTDPAGEIESVNRHYLEYFGITLDEAKRWGTNDMVHTDHLPITIDSWMRSVETGEPFDVEHRVRRADGVFRWFQSKGLPLKDAEGRIVSWFVTATDIEDRKLVEEELKATERDLIRIINTIPTTAWATRPDGYCEFLSDRWLDYAGFTYEEAVGWRWASAIHPDDAPGLQEHWLGCLATGTPVNAEARMRRFDGVYRWFLFLAQPFRDESGTIIKWYGTNVDIEDRKQAAEALRASARNLDLIINTIPMLAWSTGPDGFVEFLNKRWLDYAGMSAEEGAGWGWAAVIHPDDAKGLLDYWQAAMSSGSDVDVEARMRRFDGVYRWFLFRASPLRDEAGKIVKWYGTNVDIEERKRADEELQRSEAFLAEGQRLNLSGSFSWRLDTDEITFSDQLYRIHEFDRDTPITLELIASRLHPEDASLVSEKIALARSGHADLNLNYECRLRMQDGSVKYLRTIAHASQDREGRPEVIGAVQDVTERRLSEEALGKVRSELARMARVASLGALTASIAHEVSQPLSGIITNASTGIRMLSAGSPNVDGALETVRRTLRDGNRASDVISKLRELFGKKNFTAELVNLNEATREVIALLFGELQINRVVLRSELDATLPLVIGDRIQLQQVLLNLLLNASEAMAGVDNRPRELVVRTELDGGDSVRVTVQDSGVGIDPENMNRLFDAFHTTKNGGMGMGLSVSRSIIESLHGRLWAASNDGHGATFFFSMPHAGEDGNLCSNQEPAVNEVQSGMRNL